MAILTHLSIELDIIDPFVVISGIIFSSSVALFVLGVDEINEMVKKQNVNVCAPSIYVPTILKREDSEVEFENAVQHIRLVNSIEVPIEAKENQKVLKKSK